MNMTYKLRIIYILYDLIWLLLSYISLSDAISNHFLSVSLLHNKMGVWVDFALNWSYNHEWSCSEGSTAKYTGIFVYYAIQFSSKIREKKFQDSNYFAITFCDRCSSFRNFLKSDFVGLPWTIDTDEHLLIISKNTY